MPPSFARWTLCARAHGHPCLALHGPPIPTWVLYAPIRPPQADLRDDIPKWWPSYLLMTARCGGCVRLSSLESLPQGPTCGRSTPCWLRIAIHPPSLGRREKIHGPHPTFLFGSSVARGAPPVAGWLTAACAATSTACPSTPTLTITTLYLSHNAAWQIFTLPLRLEHSRCRSVSRWWHPRPHPHFG